jgi:hypothetical protein
MNDKKITPSNKDKNLKVSKKISVEPIDTSLLDDIINTIDSAPVSKIKTSIKIMARMLKDITNRL